MLYSRKAKWRRALQWILKKSSFPLLSPIHTFSMSSIGTFLWPFSEFLYTQVNWNVSSYCFFFCDKIFYILFCSLFISLNDISWMSFFFLPTACGILVSLQWKHSLNRWTAGEVLQRSSLIWYNENKVWVNFSVHLCPWKVIT